MVLAFYSVLPLENKNSNASPSTKYGALKDGA